MFRMLTGKGLEYAEHIDGPAFFAFCGFKVTVFDILMRIDKTNDKMFSRLAKV